MKKDDTGKRVGIWIRVSTEDQARGESPEHHERRARMYAEAKGWEVATVYDLAGYSGKSVSGHPECERMMEDVRENRIDGLIFSKLARLARNTRELLDFADFFREEEADFISLGESIDTSTPAGRLFYTIIAAMAQWEREEVSERVKASVVIRAKMGKATGGAAPFGYQWEEGRLAADPEEAPVRRLIYEIFAEEKRLKATARRLNEAGYRTRRGARFSDGTIRRLLEDPTAKGHRRANYTRSLGDGKAWVEKPEEEWIWTECPAVVSEELWEECNAILRSWKKKRKPRRKTRYLFSGLVVCHCGTKMYPLSNSPKYTCQSCRNKLPIDDLERVFAAELREFVFSPEAIEDAFAGADEEITSKQKLLENLNRERGRLSSEMEKLYRLHVDDRISAEVFTERHRPLEERRAALDEEIPRLQGELDFLLIRRTSGADILSESQDLYSRWPDLSFDERRSIVETMVERIEIGDGEIAFELAYRDSLESVARGQRNAKDSSPPAARNGRER